MMKPPEQIFPQRKAAEFDETGRPYHSMFYTGRPNFFKMLYVIGIDFPFSPPQKFLFIVFSFSLQTGHCRSHKRIEQI